MTAIEDFSLALPLAHTNQPKAQPLAREEADEIAGLVQTWSPLLFRVAYAILRSQPDAEDTVQDTFIRVLQHRKSLPHVDDLRVWLVRITWNLALDRRRRIRPDQLDGVFADRLAAVTVPADQALYESQRMQRVLAEIERLPPPERNALLLSAIEELPTPELAAILGRSESAVRALLSRARVRLRQRLEAKGTRARRKEQP